MRTSIIICLGWLVAIGAIGAARAEVAVTIEKPAGADGTACIFANGIIIDRTPCQAGQQSVTWSGTDATGTVDFTKCTNVKFTAVPLASVTIPDDDPKTPDPSAAGWVAMSLACESGDRADVIKLIVGADASQKPCKLRLSVDFIPALKLSDLILPHSLKLSTRGLLAGQHVITVEVFDACNNVGTTSVALQVKESK